MVAWWKVLEEREESMTSKEKKLQAIDTFERNMTLAFDKLEKNLMRILGYNENRT